MRRLLPIVIVGAVAAWLLFRDSSPQASPESLTSPRQLFVSPEVEAFVGAGPDRMTRVQVSQQEEEPESVSALIAKDELGQTIADTKMRLQIPAELEMSQDITENVLADASAALDRFDRMHYRAIEAKEDKEPIDIEVLAQANILYALLPNLHSKVQDGSVELRVKMRDRPARFVEGMSFNLTRDGDDGFRSITFSLRGKYSFLSITTGRSAVDPALWDALVAAHR